MRRPCEAQQQDGSSCVAANVSMMQRQHKHEQFADVMVQTWLAPCSTAAGACLELHSSLLLQQAQCLHTLHGCHGCHSIMLPQHHAATA